MRYFYSLEKGQQANHSMKTLTKGNLDRIIDIRDILSETYYFYKDLYYAEPTNHHLHSQLKAFDRVSHNFLFHTSLFQALGQWGLSNAAGGRATSRVW